ncbi:hypothetical protein D3C85_1383630 [compost metagenome]
MIGGVVGTTIGLSVNLKLKPAEDHLLSKAMVYVVPFVTLKVAVEVSPDPVSSSPETQVNAPQAPA